MDTAITETYISKLKLQDRHVYVKLLWEHNENNLFRIQIIDGDCSWSGRFSNEFAQSFRERDNIDDTELQYSSDVKMSLTGEDEGYAFELATTPNDNDTASFSWKKRYGGPSIESKGIAVLHGKVPLHRDAVPVNKAELIDILLNKNKNLKQNLKDQTGKTEMLINELEKCKNELEKYVNIKTSLESTLYGKFLQLLNAKKKRIQLLEDNLLNFEEPHNVSVESELD